jgi:hypothetical protein
MAIRDWWNRIRGIETEHPTALTKGAPVPFPRGYSQGVAGAIGEGAVLVRNGRGLLYFGDNIEGYDSLLGGAGRRGEGVDFAGFRPSDNSIVAACLGWLCTSWQTTRLLVGTRNGAEFQPLDGGHPLEELMARPHPDYDGNWLITAWLTDLFDWGNFYANIVTAGLSGPPRWRLYHADPAGIHAARAVRDGPERPARGQAPALPGAARDRDR